MHTNDTHGRFWHNDKGEYGMAAQKTLVERLRAEAKRRAAKCWCSPAVTSTPGCQSRICRMQEPDFMAMNSIRYDAMAVGNHEFDNP